jgi:hypothetical protein
MGVSRLTGCDLAQRWCVPRIAAGVDDGFVAVENAIAELFWRKYCHMFRPGRVQVSSRPA